MISYTFLIVFASLLIESLSGSVGRESRAEMDLGKADTIVSEAHDGISSATRNPNVTGKYNQSRVAADNSFYDATNGGALDGVTAPSSSNRSASQNTGAKPYKCKHDTCSADDSLAATEIPDDDIVVISEPETEEGEFPDRTTTSERYDEIHKELEKDVRQFHDTEEPDQETLERWGFFDLETMGELDELRNKVYEEYMAEMETKVPPPHKEIPQDEKEVLNAELEAFLQDDHRFQMWTAKLFRILKLENFRKKRSIGQLDESDLKDNYEQMKNPYFGKRPV